MIEYELKEAFNYGYKGEIEKAFMIQVSPPTAKNIDAISPIRQALMKAIKEAQAAPSESNDDPAPSDDGDDGLDGAVMVGILETSNQDMSKILLHFKEVATRSGLFRVDGSEPLTKPIYDKMSIDDIYGLLGEFLRAFIAASLLK